MEKETKSEITKNPYQKLMSMDGISFVDGALPALIKFLKKVDKESLEKLAFSVCQIMEFDKLVFRGERASATIFLHLPEKNKSDYAFNYGPLKGRGKEYYAVKVPHFFKLSSGSTVYDLTAYAAHLVRLRVVANFPKTVLLTCKKLGEIRAKKKLEQNYILRFFSSLTPAILTDAENCVDLSDQDSLLVSHLAANFCASVSQDVFNKPAYGLRLKSILTLDAADYLKFF